jgi:RimJ/RimL family protein N-acetyltransferase
MIRPERSANSGTDKPSFPERIETQRLVLRCYRSADAAGILELVQQNREQLIREFRQMADLRSLDDTQAFTAEKQGQWNAAKTFCYGIWRKQAEEQIGQMQVKNISWEIPAAELGYFIDRSSQRQGYASESIRGILRSAFEELRFQRIFVRILPSNRESLSLAVKLGFQQEGLHRQAFRCGFGELHSVRYLSLTLDDYRSRPE